MSENDDFNVDGRTDHPVNDLLEKARYRFKVTECKKHVSDKGNICAFVSLDVEGVRVRVWDLIVGNEDKKQVPKWQTIKWRNFLHAIGIRDSRDHAPIRFGRAEVGRCRV